MNQEQIDKFNQLREVLNLQTDVLASVVKKIDSIMNVNDYGPILNDAAVGVLISAVKTEGSQVIEALTNVLQSL